MERKIVIGLMAVCAALVSGAVLLSFVRYNPAFNASAAKPKFIIYTYSSFKDSMGPGPEILSAFKKTCFCEIEVVEAGSGHALLEKLLLAQDRQIDLVIGFDQLTLKDAMRKLKWRALKPPELAWDSRIAPERYTQFLPYDWSPLTFIYREGDLTPNLKLNKWAGQLPKNSLALQDPALSSAGLQLVYWLYSLSSPSEFVEFFKNLKPKIHSVSAKWSDSYSVFQSGHARGVFTYLTSLIYHQVEQNDHSYKAAEFAEGHPQQIEYMGIPEQCMSCGISEKFVNFMLTAENQKIIMQKNYMLPVIGGVADGTPFADLPKLKLLNTKKMDDFVDHEKEIVDRWEQAVR